MTSEDGQPAAGATDPRWMDLGSAPETPAGEQRYLRVTKASEITMRKLRWLWNDRIVLGGLTLLAGREGLGKSTLAVDFAAQVTRGVLDGEYKGEPRTVIYVNTEDARDDTIAPRLKAAGADLDRVIFVDAVTRDADGESESPIVLPTDTGLLAELIVKHSAALVILDAATSVIDGRLDGNKDREMRKGLERILKVGQDTGAAMLGIVHFGKRDSGDSGKLILGSIAWSQVARSVLSVAHDAETDQLVLTATKSNLSLSGGSLAAKIVAASVETSDGTTSVGRVEWLGESDRDAREFLSGADGDSDERSERDEAKDWLHDYLVQSGSVKSADVKKAAKSAGIAERTLQRASKKLGVQIEKKGFPRITHWSSPSECPQSCGTCQGSGATDLRAREPGATGATGADQGKRNGATGQLRQLRQPPVYGATDGATDGATGDAWLLSGDPVEVLAPAHIEIRSDSEGVSTEVEMNVSGWWNNKGGANEAPRSAP